MLKIYLLLAVAFIWQPMLYAEPSPASDITEISAAHAAFNAKSNRKNYKALFDVLETYEGVVTVETVKAYNDLIRKDVANGDFSRMRKTASAAATHYEPVSDVITRHYLEARSLAAIAGFNSRRRTESILELAHVAGRAGQVHDEDGSHPVWADDLRWGAEAWAYAMQAYFLSARKRHPSSEDFKAIVATYPHADHSGTNSDDDVMDRHLRHCRGEMEKTPPLRYPMAAQFRGTYGAVILGFKLDEAGNVQEVDVKASVPFEGFRDKATKTVSQWRFIPDESETPGETCRLAHNNVVIPLTFAIR